MDSRRQFMSKISAATLATSTSVGLPSAILSQENSPAQPKTLTGSDLGSIYPFVKRQAEKLKFPLSYTQPEFNDLEAWKAQGRAKVLELLHYAPEPCAPEAKVLRRIEKDGYIQEELTFQTTPDIRVPASLLLPKNRSQPAPGVIALHDHGAFYLWGREKLLENASEHPSLTEFRKTAYAGKCTAAELARQGYVVLTIDMFYWGERRLLLDDDREDWRERPISMSAARVKDFNRRASEYEPFTARALMTSGITWPGVMLWDDMRSVDYLISRPEVDPQKIGCVGLSVGGLRSMYLGALDKRIKASVICGWMASHPAQLKSHLRHSIGFTKLIPGATKWLDYPDIAALAMPSSVLVINGRRDALFEPAGVQACFDKLTACYQKAGFPDRFRASWYDTPHEFNVEMQAEAWKWLARWLKN